MTITVIGEDDAPLSYITSAKTDEDDLILIDVLSSAIDPEGDEISLDSVFGSTNGSVSIIDNKIQYIPDANYHGDDVITYQISDANSNVSTQNLTITVDSVNDVPILITDAASVIEDSNIVIDVLAGASDADGDLLTIANITQAANGLVAITDDNKIIYTPDANFNGQDSFSYSVTDGISSSSKTIIVAVSASNDAPISILGEASIAEDNVITLDISQLAEDIDGDLLNLSIAEDPSYGTATIVDNQLIYTPILTLMALIFYHIVLQMALLVVFIV